MLHMISGIVHNFEAGFVTINTGNFGFGVMIPSTTMYTVGQKISLFVHMYWNTEQGPSLYGFEKELDKSVFLLIISCSGIGPKIALTALGHIGSTTFIQAIEQSDQKTLSNISGIGSKKAEHMIVQLRHKVAKLLSSGVQLEGVERITDYHQVSEVLSSLHYSRSEISNALSLLREQNKGIDVPFDRLVRQALSFLAKKA